MTTSVPKLPIISSGLDSLPTNLSPLERLLLVQDFIYDAGWRWTEISSVLAKAHEDVDEIADALTRPDDRNALLYELGDLLAISLQLCAYLRVSPDDAFKAASDKIEHRFRVIEAGAHALGIPVDALPADTLRQLYLASKQESLPKNG